MDALKHAFESSKIAAAFAVVVDAENGEAIGFYEHYGFLHVLDDERRLYLPIDTIKKLEL